MLRTTILYTVSVLLALAILVVSLFAATFRSVRAAPLRPTPTATASTIVSPTPTAINYAFPYPGVLPDSPLWIFKAVRDRLLLWVTFDKVAKTELLLLYADKRLEAAKVLIEGGKPDIGVTTSIKGEKYLNDAVGELLQAQKENQNVDLVKVKIQNSLAAHLAILTTLQQKSPEISAALKEAISVNRSTTTLLP